MTMEILSAIIDSVSVLSLSLLAAAIGLLWYLRRPSDYWKNCGIPSHQGSFLWLLLFKTKNVHEVELEKYRKYGRIYGACEGSRPTLFVGDLDILRNVFVKDFPIFTGPRQLNFGGSVGDKLVINLRGEDWKRVRGIMTPAFSTGKIKRMMSIFIDSGRTLIANFKAAADEGKPVDVKPYFGAFAMDVIACTAFATKIDSHNDPENVFVVHAKSTFSNPFPWRFFMAALFPGLMKFLRIGVFPPDTMNFFEKVVLQIVEERKKSKQRRNDFLQLMLDAVEREGKDTEDLKETEDTKEMGHEEDNEQVFSSYQSSKSLSNIEMVANCITFFLAGYESVSSTMAFTAYELALNPDIQDRAIEEIDEAIKRKGGLNYEAVCEMKYLDNIISETLRKYPASVRAERVASEDYVIKDGRNLEVPLLKGTIVVAPIYCIHHDPEHYPNPEKYDPDRFSQEQKSSRHPYAYFPFGAGPRNCLGMRFALMEIKVCLATVLSQCRFRKCSHTKVPLEFRRFQVLMQAKQVVLETEFRKERMTL